MFFLTGETSGGGQILQWGEGERGERDGREGGRVGEMDPMPTPGATTADTP